ncbi:hypothetical protein [Streptomyces sp. NPDC051704]|uniref:hypothetical protein n=1 Tax=Streptomyces sp. NPDC051704 TaxID=3365671 RepID=UPI00378C7693
MTERRVLRAGSRRARLAAEAGDAPCAPAEEPTVIRRPSGRRQLGTGTTAR